MTKQIVVPSRGWNRTRNPAEIEWKNQKLLIVKSAAFELQIDRHPFGGAGIDRQHPLPDETPHNRENNTKINPKGRDWGHPIRIM